MKRTANHYALLAKSAEKAGVSVEKLIELRDSGLQFCFFCQRWLWAADNFRRDTRLIGKFQAKCKQCEKQYDMRRRPGQGYEREPTEEELEQTIQKQMENLPDWWNEEDPD